MPGDKAETDKDVAACDKCNSHKTRGESILIKSRSGESAFWLRELVNKSYLITRYQIYRKSNDARDSRVKKCQRYSREH